MDAKWYSQWKTYVGFDDWNTSSVGDQSANPGPVDNSFIVMKGTIPFAIHYHYSYAVCGPVVALAIGLRGSSPPKFSSSPSIWEKLTVNNLCLMSIDLEIAHLLLSESSPVVRFAELRGR